MAPWLLLVLSATGNPYLEEGLQAYRAQSYERAIARLTLARDVSTSTPDEKQQILELLARAYAAVGKLDAAEGAYAELLAQDPHAPVPTDVAPKLRAAFLRAKQRLFAPDHVRLRVLPSVPYRADVWVEDPWSLVGELRVVSLGEGAEPTRVPLAVEKHLASYELGANASPRFFVEAVAVNGVDVVARVGSPEAPLVRVPAGLSGEPASSTGEAPPAAVVAPAVTVEAPAPERPWRGWPVVMGSAAVIAAVIGGALVASGYADASEAQRTRWGSDARLLNEQARTKVLGAWGAGTVSFVAAGLALVFWLRW